MPVILASIGPRLVHGHFWLFGRSPLKNTLETNPQSGTWTWQETHWEGKAKRWQGPEGRGARTQPEAHAT